MSQPYSHIILDENYKYKLQITSIIYFVNVNISYNIFFLSSMSS